MPETEPSQNSTFKSGCFPLLVPFVTVIILIILVLLSFWAWGRITQT